MFPQKPLEAISVRASRAARYYFEGESGILPNYKGTRGEKQEENEIQLPVGLTV